MSYLSYFWRTIKNFENYEINPYGKIRHKKRGKILSISICNHGYYKVNLWKNGKNHTRRIHRLIAKVFLANSKNKPEINHIDGNKLNNSLYNLEWCTHKENMKHANKLGLVPYKYGKEHYNNISVKQLNLHTGKIVNIYFSIIEAERQTNIKSQNIGKVCKKKRKSAGGFNWEYVA